MTSQLFEDIKTLSIILPEQIRRYDRMEVVVKFMQAKKDHPDYTKTQLCALIGVSDSYLKRVMKDLDIKSFYRNDIPVNTPRKTVPNKNIDNGQPKEDMAGGEISDEYIDNLIRIKD